MLFPEPQQARYGERMLQLAGGALWTIVLPDAASPEEHSAALSLQAAMNWAGSAPPIVSGASQVPERRTIVLGTPSTALDELQTQPVEAPRHNEQAYRLQVTPEQVLVIGNTPQAVRYGVRTLIQLLQRRSDGIYLREVTIVDWPDMAYRGIYVECRWGPDLMTLNDWRRAIDYLADLKLNVMGIGIHNNWPSQYDGKRSEFLLVPSRRYPALNQPKNIDYYSPKAGAWQHLEYLPKMVLGDFFGQIVAYGRERGVLVRPHYNTPGHNSLIPRVIPETSALDEAGRPTGYGFCLTNPRTYEVMYDILDEIVEHYLLPNGVDWFHLGLDEVWVSRGIDEQDLLRPVSPFCRCPRCREKPWEDHFVDYVVHLSHHLRERGIRHIGMWNDSFVRGGRMNRALAERFEREGLQDAVVLHWWQYHDYYDTIHPELGLRRWVVPMTGYFYWENYRDHLDNIWLALAKGHQEGAEGTEAYGVFARCFDRQYHLLADQAWNGRASDRLAEFRDKYIVKVFGQRSTALSEAFREFDEAVRGKYINLTTSLFYYTYAYADTPERAHVKANYPQAVLAQLLDDPLLIRSRLGEIRAGLARARGLWAGVPPRDAQQAELLAILDLEALRIETVTDVFLRLVSLLKAYEALRHLPSDQRSSQGLQRAATETGALLSALDNLMARTEEQADSYLVPQSLRELSLIRRFLANLQAELAGLLQRLQASELADLPPLRVMECKPVAWPEGDPGQIGG